MAAVFYENMKTTFLVQNIADFKVWTLYTYVFMGKESIFGVIFVIWPLNREIGAKMTLFGVKIGPKSTFLDITLRITQTLHSKSKDMGV